MNIRVRTVFLFFIVGILGTQSFAQSSTAGKDVCLDKAKDGFTLWINCKVFEAVKSQTSQRDSSKQVQAPSVAGNATSLVDQTGAPDVLGLAMDLAGLSSNNNGAPGSGNANNNGPSGSITFTAYALYAAIAQHDPLDPTFYNGKSDLRRFSFTLGRDTSNPNAPASEKPLLFGTKILILNWRDASVRHNATKLNKVSDELGKAALSNKAIVEEVRRYLYAELAVSHGYPKAGMSALENENAFFQKDLDTDLQNTLGGLSQKQAEGINAIVSKHVEASVALLEKSKGVIKKIRSAPQLSYTFQSSIGFGVNPNDYKTGFAFDYGMAPRVNLTFNGTFEHKDNKGVMPNSDGARLSFQSSFQLNNNPTVLGSNKPILLSVAGEADWMTKMLPTYTGQVKLTIPIFNGINLPISLSVANRTSLVNEKNVFGNFGFTFDLAKLLSKQ